MWPSTAAVPAVMGAGSRFTPLGPGGYCPSAYLGLLIGAWAAVRAGQGTGPVVTGPYLPQTAWVAAEAAANLVLVGNRAQQGLLRPERLALGEEGTRLCPLCGSGCSRLTSPLFTTLATGSFSDHFSRTETQVEIEERPVLALRWSGICPQALRAPGWPRQAHRYGSGLGDQRSLDQGCTLSPHGSQGQVTLKWH